jgi:hypothetical protein
MNMRELLNKLDNVSADTVSEDGRYRNDAGRPHDFYRQDNYYGNPRQYSQGTSSLIPALVGGAAGYLLGANRQPNYTAPTPTPAAAPTPAPISAPAPAPAAPAQDTTSGSPTATTKAPVDNADKAAKVNRFKELLAKSDAAQLKEGFTRDSLLEKLRSIESGYQFNEGLTPDEYKELSKLYGDLSVDYANDPSLAPLFAQYQKIPPSWAASNENPNVDAAKPDTAAAPADTTKTNKPASTPKTTKPGDPRVAALQTYLNSKGAKLAVDGKFGKNTAAAERQMFDQIKNDPAYQKINTDVAAGLRDKTIRNYGIPTRPTTQNTAGTPANTTKDDGKWTGSAKDWGSAIGGGLGAAGLGALGGAGGAALGPAGAVAGAVGGGAIGHDIGADLGGRAGEWLGQVGDKIGKAIQGQPAPATTTKESVEVKFAEQLIESFGYDPKK